jgi:hypothetical protein
MCKTVYDLLKENATTLHALARAGIAIEDVANIEIFEEFKRLSDDGMKTTAIVAHLCDEYARSERSVWRLVKRFRRVIV